MPERNLTYLQDSVDIYDSLQLCPDDIGRILDAPRAKFTSLGYVVCDALGAELPIGIKKRAFTNDRAVHEHTVAALLGESQPTIVHSSLPAFIIGLSYGSHPVGILTEDFTENRSVELVEESFRVAPFASRHHMPTTLHEAVFDALGGKVYEEAMGHMTALVGGRRVLMDFNDIGFDTDEPYRSMYELVKGQQPQIVRDISG